MAAPIVTQRTRTQWNGGGIAVSGKTQLVYAPVHAHYIIYSVCIYTCRVRDGPLFGEPKEKREREREG